MKIFLMIGLVLFPIFFIVTIADIINGEFLYATTICSNSLFFSIILSIVGYRYFNVSIAKTIDELNKLRTLKLKKLITDEEFINLKSKILGKL